MRGSTVLRYMRRDIAIGVMASVILHGGFAGFGQWLKKAPSFDPEIELDHSMVLPFPTPEPELVEDLDDPEEEPKPQEQFQPPIGIEIPVVREKDVFLIPPTPRPDPTLISTGLTTIPTIGTGKTGKVFDRSVLDQVPRAVAQVQPVYP